VEPEEILVTGFKPAKRRSIQTGVVMSIRRLYSAYGMGYLIVRLRIEVWGFFKEVL
jgi:hypothetical protein